MNRELVSDALGLSLAAFIAVLTIGCGYMIFHEVPTSPEQPDISLLRAEIHELHEMLQSPRCITVNTPVFNVYDTPNLGVKKVEKP